MLLGAVVLLPHGAVQAQSAAPAKSLEKVAVMDLTPVGAQKTQAAAVTDRLREELLASGRFTLVSRDQVDTLLNEQATQQRNCTSPDCAVQLGKMLGVRKIISGRLTRLEDDLWLMAVTLVDVETARTERAASVTHDGKFVTLMTEGVRKLSAKLIAQ
jgi:hypothetical protein